MEYAHFSIRLPLDMLNLIEKIVDESYPQISRNHFIVRCVEKELIKIYKKNGA